MSNVVDLVPRLAPPYEDRRRAWECGYVLRQDYNGRLLADEHRAAQRVVMAGPDRIGWREIGSMHALYVRRVGARR